MKNGVGKPLLTPVWFILYLSMLFCAFQPGAVEAAADKEVINAAGNAPSVLSLAKVTENPIADVEYIRLQYDTFTGGVLGNKTMSVVNLQPSFSTHLNKDWNLITKAVIPFISAPTPEGRKYAVGDSLVTMFFSPRTTGATIWGIGPTMQFPTATKASLGAKSFGIGPAAAIIKQNKQWIYGARMTYMHRVGKAPNNIDTNLFTVQPIVNYSIPGGKGLSISFNPLISCDFSRKPGDRWLVPLGLQINQVIKAENRPISIDIGIYKNVTRTSSAPEWNYRFQLTFLLPK